MKLIKVNIINNKDFIVFIFQNKFLNKIICFVFLFIWKELNSASEKQEQKASLFRIEQQVKAETKSNISTKTQESLKSKQASDRAVKIDIDPKQIKKEIEESLEAEKQSEISSPIKKVAEIKDNSKIKKADKTVEKEQSQKVRKSENKKKDSHKSKQQSAKESEKAEAAAQNKKLAKAKKTKKATEKVENNSQSKLNPKEKTNLNNNNNNNKNSINKINEKNINKIINNNENKINNKNDSDSESAIESEIEKLKTQVKNLIQMNDALVKHLEKIDSKKRESKIDKNLIGFVQKYEGKVKEIDSKLKEEKKAVSADLSKKEKSLKNLFENTNLNFNEIKSQVKNLNAKLNEIEEKQKEKEDALKTGFEGDKLTIEKNLNVKGIAYSKKVFTKQINLQNVQISENVFKVKEDTRLEIGSESFDFSEIAKLLSYVETIKAHCGEDFELCGVVGEEEKMNVEIKKQQIVENLRKLKGDNSRVFSGKRGARDGRKDRNLRR